VQDFRKQSDLEIADRIHLYFAATPGLMKAVEAFKDYVMAETLTVELLPVPIPPHLTQTSDTFDGEEVTLGISRVS
jgi:isoleucyl-tRNA synthetase